MREIVAQGKQIMERISRVNAVKPRILVHLSERRRGKHAKASLGLREGNGLAEAIACMRKKGLPDGARKQPMA